MDISKISTGRHPPGDINVIIEVSMGGEPVKYELCKESGALMVDRFLQTSMFYPGNYGFIPHTLSEDGDPCDVLVLSEVPVIAGAVIPARPIGAMVMEDEAGQDEKIIAVPTAKIYPHYSTVNNYSELPPLLCERIAHFFEHYKDLEEGKWVRMDGWVDAAGACRLIDQAIERYKAARAG
jgi:inorganic pyrophosphatase